MPVPSVEYRHASWRELRPVLALEEACFGADAWPWIDVLAALSLPDAVRIKAQVGTATVGFVFGERRDRRRVGWISSLAVAPGFRRQGIARELLRRCELELSTRLLRLALRRTNEGALALYLSEGYRQIEVWPAYYRDGEDGLVMGKPGSANKG